MEDEQRQSESSKKKPAQPTASNDLPQSVLVDEIMTKMDVESVCSAAATCRTMRHYASQLLSTISTLDLSGLCVDERMLNCVLGDNKVLNSLSLNCFQLHGSSITPFLISSIHELVLLKCTLLTYEFVKSIAQSCPQLRVLVLELVDDCSTLSFNLAQTLEGCPNLESMSLKVRGVGVCVIYPTMRFILPKAIKLLQLQPVIAQDVISKFKNITVPLSLKESYFKLHTLSLVLDVISDELILIITQNLTLLAELDLKDKPMWQSQLQNHDLTNLGIQSLAGCSRLTRLSLRRSRQYCSTVSFRRVSDVAIFFLAEGCKSLESVRLDGFTKVTDAGFGSILHSCPNMKKFEVFNSETLTDLTFHDIKDARCSLTEVGLVSCRHITSETMEKLSLCKDLVVLHLSGCKSIGDRWLTAVSALTGLTTINLARTNVTDSGLSALSLGNAPIVSLCLRGCERVTDQGVALLFQDGKAISTSLTFLDLGNIPKISDVSIFSISKYGLGVTDLCIKYCCLVTDAGLEALSSKRRSNDGSKPIQKLDLYECVGLSLNTFMLLRRPSFPRLTWLGVGNMCFLDEYYANFAEFHSDRPWLTVCFNGCEIGCGEGWNYHY